MNVPNTKITLGGGTLGIPTHGALGPRSLCDCHHSNSENTSDNLLSHRAKKRMQ